MQKEDELLMADLYTGIIEEGTDPRSVEKAATIILRAVDLLHAAQLSPRGNTLGKVQDMLENALSYLGYQDKMR